MDIKYDSTYQYSAGWDVPSYAPSGHYDVKITGLDPSKKTDLCVNASFDL